MTVCRNCNRYVNEQSILCQDCLDEVFNAINTIKPSTTENLECEDLFTEYLCESMTDFVIKDIRELFDCISFELWTASVLMSARILESQLKAHIESDLNEKSPDTIGGCIYLLKNKGYDKGFIEMLEELRELRNDAMHAERRFSPSDTLDIVKKVLIIVASIHNIG